MAQPTSYTPATDFSAEELASVGGRSTVRTAAVDAEFDALAVTLGGVLTNLALNQRDDGEIRDERVKLHTLASDVKALMLAGGLTTANLKGAWLTATSYSKLDLVSQSSNTYICVTAHTSGTFATDLAAGKWLLLTLGTGQTASGISFTPTVLVPLTNVQAAIELLSTQIDTNKDANALTYVAGSPSAATRTVRARLREIPTARDDGAVGDGVTDDTTALNSIIAYCYSNDLPLYWSGAFKVTGNLLNFHDVRHIGKATITRGTDVWTIGGTEATSMTLYANPAGSSTNDGLTSAYPISTIAKCIDIIVKRAPLTGRYTVQLSASNFVETLAPSSLTTSDYPIDIRGPAVGGGVPTATITVAVVGDDGLTFSVGGWWRVYDVNLVGGGGAGTAVVATRTQVGLTNVRASGFLGGCTSLHGSFVSMTSCKFTGRGKAVAGGVGYTSLYNVTHNINSGNTFELYERGMLINEGAQGHLDGTVVQDCGTGIGFQRGAGAVNTDSMVIKRCDLGVDARSGWFNSNISFGTGADANTVNVRTTGDGFEFSFRTNIDQSKTCRQQTQTTITSHTGTTTETTVWSYDFKDWMVSEGKDTIYLDGDVNMTALVGTLRIRAYLYDGTSETSLASVLIPAGTTFAHFLCKLWFTSSSAERFRIECFSNSGGVANAQLQSYNEVAVSLKNKVPTLRLKYTLSNAADSVPTVGLSLNTTLGG